MRSGQLAAKLSCEVDSGNSNDLEAFDNNFFQWQEVSLEKIGVTPDEILLPNSMDLMNRYDLVLSRAFFLFGLVLGADDAGKLFNAKVQRDKGSKN